MAMDTMFIAYLQPPDLVWPYLTGVTGAAPSSNRNVAA